MFYFWNDYIMKSEFWKFHLHQYLVLSRSLPHRKCYPFFFFFSSQTDWRSQRKAVPKEFSHNIPEANKFNMAIPPFFFFFFFDPSILTHFKTWQTKKTWKKSKMKVSKMANDEVSVKYCYSKRNIIDRVHSSFYKGLKHLLKKWKAYKYYLIGMW